MAKIGPGTPAFPRTPGSEQRKSQVATPQEQAATKAPTKGDASVNAQQVAQQFMSAFVSAGKLAGMLVKGLVPTPPQQQTRRTEKNSSSETAGSESKGEPESLEAQPGLMEASDNSAVMSSLAALKRTRVFRFRKKLRKSKGGTAEVSSHIILPDDWKEKERDHQRARYYLGDDQEETEFDEAKREAFVLQRMERQGAPPTQVARHLNSLMGMDRDREFKHMLSDQVRPQMDELADKIGLGDTPAEERRLLAALVSRAAYQVGVRSSENFARLLATAGAEEALQLLETFEDPALLAAELAQALRRAVDPSYRAGLIGEMRAGLEKLAGDALELSPERQHLTWVSLLRSAEALELEVLPALAEPLVSGLLERAGSEAAGPLADALSTALWRAPGGGCLAVQLVVSLAARDEVAAAVHVAGVLREVLREARASTIPAITALRDLGLMAPGRGGDHSLFHELEERAPLLASLIPTCSHVLEKGQGIPPAASPVLAEALLSLGTLNYVGGTAAGQHLLRRALLAQERSQETFLSSLPRAALTLAQPKLARALTDSGLNSAHFQFGGRPFMERIALYLGRAAAGTVAARTQKGDSATAKVLLRSAIRSNGALFGLTPDGAHLAAEAIEALRSRPDPISLRGTQYQLGKIRKKYALGQQHPGGIDPFQDLLAAVAAIKPPSPTQHSRPADVNP